MPNEKKQTEKLTKKKQQRRAPDLKTKRSRHTHRHNNNCGDGLNVQATRRLIKPNRKEQKCPREKVIHARFCIRCIFIRLEYVSNRQTRISTGDHKESYATYGLRNEERRA